MNTKNFLQIAASMACLSQAPIASADRVDREIGRSLGEFSGGFADSVTSTLYKNRPTWVTIKPRPKEECMKESGGMINVVFMKCRNGYEAQVVKHDDGSVTVLQERQLKY